MPSLLTRQGRGVLAAPRRGLQARAPQPQKPKVSSQGIKRRKCECGCREVARDAEEGREEGAHKPVPVAGRPTAGRPTAGYLGVCQQKGCKRGAAGIWLRTFQLGFINATGDAVTQLPRGTEQERRSARHAPAKSQLGVLAHHVRRQTIACDTPHWYLRRCSRITNGTSFSSTSSKWSAGVRRGAPRQVASVRGRWRSPGGSPAETPPIPGRIPPQQGHLPAHRPRGPQPHLPAPSAASRGSKPACHPAAGGRATRVAQGRRVSTHPLHQRHSTLAAAHSSSTDCTNPATRPAPLTLPV